MTVLTRVTAAACLWLSLTALSCKQGVADRSARSTPTFRAVDTFDAESVVAEPGATGPAVSRALIEDSFEAGVSPEWQVALTGGRGGDASTLYRPFDGDAFDGTRGLEIGQADGVVRGLPQLHRFVDVEPGRTYRLSGAVRTVELAPSGRESVGASIEILEWARGAEPRFVAQHGHLPRERGTSQDWRRLDYVFRTSPEAARVSVALVPSNVPAAGLARFDAISLVELSPIEALWLSPPHRSRGQPAAHAWVRDVTLADDTRPAILSPAGSVWEWPVAGVAGAHVRVAIAAVGDSDAAGTLCFRISWESSPLFEECVEPGGPGPSGGPGWTDVGFDLPAEATRGTLRFETGGPDGASTTDTVAAWGQPRVTRRPAQDDGKPNIVLIVYDTLRADHLGAAGYTAHPTSPNLDAFAREAVRFATSYAPSGWTATSLGSLMTARYPAQHGAGLRVPREIEMSDQVVPTARRALGVAPLAPGETTLAEILRDAGYDTAGFHGNAFFGAELGFDRGFDRYRFNRGEDLDAALDRVELARRWLERRRASGVESPFFLTVHFMDPHIPYRMRREFYDDFGPPLMPPGRAFDPGLPFVSFPDWPRRELSAAEIERVVAAYDAEIAFADRATGRLLEILDGIADDTIVVVVADHGEAFGEHGHFEHGNSMYDELLRVPIWVRLPGGRGAGTTVDEPAGLIDVAPTLLALVGLEPPPAIEGRVLALPGLRATRRPRPGLLAEGAFLGPDQTALIEDGYKYVWTHPQGYFGFQDGTPEERRARQRRPATEALFRLQDDPHERRDRAAEDVARVAEMRAATRAWIEESAYGLHLQCAGSGGAFGLESSATIAEVKPMTTEDSDRFGIAPSRRQLFAAVGATDGAADEAADEDWLIVRWLEADVAFTLTGVSDRACSFTLSGDDDRVTATPEVRGRLTDPALRNRPPAPPAAGACSCRIWVVPDPNGGVGASGSGLTGEAIDRLRALGYVN